MNQTTRKQVLEKLRRRYKTAGAEHRRKLIDQAVQLLGYHRKAAIRGLCRQAVERGPLVLTGRPVKYQQWVSSGFDEPRAQEVRGGAFQRAQRQRSARSLVWLRRLHRSHLPQEGPFSICMHREDAVTVSYTEVSVFGNRARLEHLRGAPCNSSEVSRHYLQVPFPGIIGAHARL